MIIKEMNSDCVLFAMTQGMKAGTALKRELNPGTLPHILANMEMSQEGPALHP
jgi:hypothetical protein